MRARTRAAAVSAVLAGTILLAGCNPGGNEWSAESALKRLPASAADEERFVVYTGDIEAALKASDLTRGDDIDAADWLPAVQAVDPDGPAHAYLPLDQLLGEARAVEEQEKTWGWSVNDVDSFAAVYSGAGRLVVVIGDVAVPDGTVDSAVPLTFAEKGGAVAYGTSETQVSAFRDEGKTLGDDASLTALARALDEEDVISAALSPAVDPAGQAGAQASEAEKARLAAESSLPETPFDTVGIGWAVEDGASRAYVAYHFTKKPTKADIATLKENWSEGSTMSGRPVQDVATFEDIEAEGNVVVVELSPAGTTVLAQLRSLLDQGDPLFASA